MPAWKPFKFTYVLYREDDPLGKYMAAITLSPMLIAFGLGSAFLVTRQLPWMWSLLGILMMDGICLVLKELINQPRPEGSYRDGPGMPSEHAAFAAFVVVHLSLWVCCRTRCAAILKALSILAMATWALLVAFSRHHFGVHSALQILTGVGLGCTGGCVWFAMELYLVAEVLCRAQNGLDKLWEHLNIRCEGYSKSHGD
mmetsp:Transcript_36144/g.83295  ORF Transcript_36144/g.83295 Transcript_36144/m.83295 type:complete len:199 (+) Transcript_36144:51-647(+)